MVSQLHAHMMDQRVYTMEDFLADGRTTCVQEGDTCSDAQHFDRMLSDMPFHVSPFSLQPSVCAFSDSTKAQCHVAVPMSFGLVACASVFSDGPMDGWMDK